MARNYVYGGGGGGGGRWLTHRLRLRTYRKISNIRRTLVGNKIVDHSDVVGASPVGAAPTTSSFSTWHLASRDLAKTSSSQYENLLSVELWCAYIRDLTVLCFRVWHGQESTAIVSCGVYHSYVPNDDVIKWKHFPRFWPFVWGIHRWPVNSPYKGQCLGALMFSLICVWINAWVNNREAGDLRIHRAHYDVTVMQTSPSTSKVLETVVESQSMYK